MGRILVFDIGSPFREKLNDHRFLISPNSVSTINIISNHIYIYVTNIPLKLLEHNL